MSRLVLPLILLLGACNAPIQGPNFAFQPPPLQAPRAADADARFQACRAEATRVVTFRERTQVMRNDDLASNAGGFSNTTAMPTWQRQMDQSSAEAERDRLTRACMAASEPVPAPQAAQPPR
jgi:hypothetical protein